MRHPDSFGVEPALDALNRRKWLAIATFAATAAALLAGVRALPDLYRATATVLVERQQVSEQFVTSSVTAELETRIQSIQQEVLSRGRLTELIERFDLYADIRAKAPIEAAVERMRKDIRPLELKGVDSRLTGRSATVAFSVGYIGRDPHTVAEVANALAALYVEENTRVREGQAVQTADFLRAQLDAIRKEMDGQEAAASGFRLRHLGELPEQMQANLASLERLNTQLRLNGENQIRALDRRERLEKELAESTVALVEPQRVSPVDDQRARLQQQLTELRTRFTEDYPDVGRVLAELAALDGPKPAAPAARTLPTDPTPRLEQALADVDRELAALRQEELALQRAVVGYEQRVENVPRRHEELEALSRDYRTTKERYDTLFKRYQEAQLAESLEQGKKVEHFRILDPALPPRFPTAPARTRLLAVGLILALSLAIGAVLAAEKLNTSFHDADELRDDLPGHAVVVVPFIPTIADARRRRHRLVLAAIGITAAISLLAAGAHYVSEGNEQLVRLAERGDV
jgi:polysaccharide chain length determinant protein (PEP-CTERM system associated)